MGWVSERCWRGRDLRGSGVGVVAEPGLVDGDGKGCRVKEDDRVDLVLGLPLNGCLGRAGQCLRSPSVCEESTARSSIPQDVILDNDKGVSSDQSSRGLL